jgi:hypothetical protein
MQSASAQEPRPGQLPAPFGHLSPAAVALACLWVVAIFSHFGYQVGGVRLRFSEAASLGVLAAVLLFVRPRLKPFWPPLLLPLAYVAVQTFATALNPADWSRGFKLDLLLGLEALIAILAAYLVSTVDLTVVARIIVGAAGLEALIAIGLMAARLLGLTTFGVEADPATGLCKTYATMWEPNLLASYLAAVLVFLLAVRRLIGPTWLQAVGTAAMGIAIGLTLTRAAWLALLPGVGALLLLQARARIKLGGKEVLSGLVLGGLVAAAAASVLLAASNGVCGHVVASKYQSVSVTGRITNNRLALQEWTRSPWWGLGTGSVRAHQPGDPNPPWIATMGVGILHDTGLIGSWIIIALILALLWGLVGWRSPRSDPERLTRYGLAAAVVVLLVAFQATTGELMEFTWLFVGTALGVLYARRRPVQTAA